MRAGRQTATGSGFLDSKGRGPLLCDGMIDGATPGSMALTAAQADSVQASITGNPITFCMKSN